MVWAAQVAAQFEPQARLHVFPCWHCSETFDGRPASAPPSAAGPREQVAPPAQLHTPASVQLQLPVQA